MKEHRAKAVEEREKLEIPGLSGIGNDAPHVAASMTETFNMHSKLTLVCETISDDSKGKMCLHAAADFPDEIFLPHHLATPSVLP